MEIQYHEKEEMMSNDHTFVSEMDAKLEYWKKEIMKFRIIAEVADPDAQIEHYQIIEDIVAKEDEVVEKLSEFTASQAVDRTSLKNEVKERRQRVDDAIEAARVKIN